MNKNLSFTLFTRLAAAVSLVAFTLVASLPFQWNAAIAAPDFSGCGGGMNVPVQNGDYEQQVVDLVNQRRAEVGAPPLKRSTTLDNSARYQSTDMAQDGYFLHDSYDVVNGVLTRVCLRDTRIKTWYMGESMGENIAAGYGTPDSVMTGWMNDTGHMANILSTNYSEIGVGYYSGAGSYGVYWTQDFGRRGSVYPLLINRDAAHTDTVNVALYIYGAWTQMRLHNDNDAPGAWQPFQQRFNWTLNPGVGDHTVTAELTAGSQSATTSDTINLTKDPTPRLGALPESIGFIYSLADHKFAPPSLSLSPVDQSAGNTLTWTVTSQGNWFSVQPATGASPANLTITPTQADTFQPGVYAGSLTVTVTSPASTLNSPHATQLTLVVVAGPLQNEYLPIIGH